MTIEELYTLYRKNPVVSTDSRNIPKGCLFFALKGANFNGNKFAQDALGKGAAYAVIDEEEYISENCILVEDVLTTLQLLAHHHRMQFSIPFIAICGSNGKTTTKELVHSVLSSKFNTIATRGNLNNHIGVPLTLLSIPHTTEVAVIEIGANHIGETAELCKIAAPDYGIITNNGKDHLEGFGSIEGVKKANGELFEWLKESEGTAFVNDQHPDLISASENIQRICYGTTPDSTYQIKPVPEEAYATVHIEPSSTTVKSQLAGSFNWENIATAIAIGKYFKVPDVDIYSAIENYTPGMNRSQILEKDGAVYVVDCYNANPSSMQLALKSFSEMEGNHKAIVLGDMLELGKYSDPEHEAIVKMVGEMGFEKVILVGNYFGKYHHLIDSIHFTTSEKAKAWFTEQDWKDWFILLKGSRGYQLEKIINS